MASHTGCQLQVLGLLAGDGLDCIGCTACWASCTWTRTDRTKRYHVGDRLHRSFQLCLPLGPSLEAGSEDRTEDEDRPLFSIQLACGTHRLVGLLGLQAKAKSRTGTLSGIDLPVVNILKYGGHTNEIVAVTPKVASGPKGYAVGE